MYALRLASIRSYVLVFLVLTAADANDTCSNNAGNSKSLLQIKTSSSPANVPPANQGRNTTARKSFEDIYDDIKWGVGGGGSGLGSDVSYTFWLRMHLKWLIQKYNLTFMIDMPCGAMVWTETFLNDIWQDRPDFKYIGIDIVGSVVSDLRTRFANDAYKGRVHVFRANLANPNFADYLAGFLDGVVHGNIPNEADFQPLNSNFPFSLDRGAVSGRRGFTLTRDALQHLSLDRACGVLANIQRLSQLASFQVVGSYEIDNPSNVNITVGDMFLIDLRDPPFSLPNPTHRLEEQTPDGKFLYCFQLQYSWVQKEVCSQG